MSGEGKPSKTPGDTLLHLHPSYIPWVRPFMSQKPKPPLLDEKRIRKLLNDYACPVPFHEVRTRFMGNIATPEMNASPIRLVQDLWGGTLPEFESEAAANELIGGLIQGLWNDLARHQKRTKPFRLSRIRTEPNLADLARLSLRRREELDGFIEGLYNGEKEIELPIKARAAVDILGEIRSMFAGAYNFTLTDTQPSEAFQLEETFKHLREMARITEREINNVILDCTRARRQMLEGIIVERPTLH